MLSSRQENDISDYTTIKDLHQSLPSESPDPYLKDNFINITFFSIRHIKSRFDTRAHNWTSYVGNLNNKVLYNIILRDILENLQFVIVKLSHEARFDGVVDKFCILQCKLLKY